MEQESMTLDQFRQARQSGVDLYAEQPQVEVDAAPTEQGELHETVEQEETEVHEQPEPQETDENADLSDDNEEDLPPLPKEQQNAFYKRAQREREKAAREAEERLKKEFESQLNPYKQFFDQLGISPEEALRVTEQNRLQQEIRGNVQQQANNLAYQYGWDEDQTRQWVEQQTQVLTEQRQLKAEQTSMKVQLKIYELADSPDYPKIKEMKGQITDFISKNPSASVEQAYWAVGGQQLAQQIKREAEQREAAKRSKAKRTVVTGSGEPIKGEDSLPPEAIAFARQNHMSEAEVRRLMQADFPKDLQSYRKMMKQGRK